MLKNIKLILFDMDGVLFNSKTNMKLSWKEVQKKFKINKSFKQYFKHIGIPFKQILKKIKISKNIDTIENCYQKASSKYLNKIRIYPNVITTINKLKKKNIKLGILTSKHRGRTIKLINHHELKFKFISTPAKGLRGKPHPDQINKAIRKFKFQRKNIVYVGDMGVDYVAAKKSGINYIHASYGYGQITKKFKYSIKKFSQLNKIVI